MSGELVIKIINWEKYQSRSKNGGPLKWVKLHTKLLHNAVAQELPPVAFKAYINLILQAGICASADGVLRLNEGGLRAVCGRYKGGLKAVLRRLEGSGLLSYQELTAEKCVPEERRVEERRVVGKELTTPLIGESKPLLKTESEPIKAEAFFVELMHRYSASPLKAKTVMMLSPKERAKAHALLTHFPDPQYWDAVMRRAERSDFLCGKTEKPFRFSLPFLLQPHSHIEIMNGKYDGFSEFVTTKVKYEFAND